MYYFTSAKHIESQIVYMRPVSANLKRCCVEGDGLGGNPCPQQSEGRHAASTLGNFSNSNPGAVTKHFIFKRFEISCGGKRHMTDVLQ